MALSPSEVTNSRSARRAEQVAALETQIDTQLTATVDPPGPIEVNAGVSAGVVDDVVNAYRALGWTVSVDLDFHGNRRLSFAAP